MATGIPFGKYTLTRRLARGGMAEVFLAMQQGPGGFERTVAVKRILPHLADVSQFLEMFMDEAQLAAQLSHPNIAHIYDFGAVEDSYFIAMEYIDGIDLSAVLLDCKINPLPLEHAARIIADLCAALHYAHQLKGGDGNPLGIVHRDISPQNILVSFDGAVKVVDFGIAKAAHHIERTNPGVVRGKFSYMSPEQAQRKTLDGRSDLFCAGIVLYELCTAEFLFPRTDAGEALKRIRQAEIPKIARNGESLPPLLDKIIQRSLARNRDDRFQTAAEMQLELETYLRSSSRISNTIVLGEYFTEHYRSLRPPPLSPSAQRHIKGSNGTEMLGPRRRKARGEDTARGFATMQGAIAIEGKDASAGRGSGSTHDAVELSVSELLPASDQIDAHPSGPTVAYTKQPQPDPSSAATVAYTKPSPSDISSAPTVAYTKPPPSDISSAPTVAYEQLSSSEVVVSTSGGRRQHPVKDRTISVDTGDIEVASSEVSASSTTHKAEFTQLVSEKTRLPASLRRIGNHTILAAIIATVIVTGVALAVWLSQPAEDGLSRHSNGSDVVLRMMDGNKEPLGRSTPASMDASVSIDRGMVMPANQGLLYVISTPSRGRVMINGRRMPGLTPVSHSLPTGQYGVTVTYPGYERQTMQVSIAAGQSHEVRFILRRETYDTADTVSSESVEATPPKKQVRRGAKAKRASKRRHAKRRSRGRSTKGSRQADYGFITITTIPWSTVYMDGREIGITPLANKRVPVGVHKLRFVNPGHREVNQWVKVRPGEVTKIRLRLP